MSGTCCVLHLARLEPGAAQHRTLSSLGGGSTWASAHCLLDQDRLLRRTPGMERCRSGPADRTSSSFVPGCQTAALPVASIGGAGLLEPSRYTIAVRAEPHVMLLPYTPGENHSWQPCLFRNFIDTLNLAAHGHPECADHL